MLSLDILQVKIATLQQQLEIRDPGYKNSLEECRVTLQKDPELVHLLKPDTELHVIFAAMQHYSQVEIPVVAEKKEKNKILGKALDLNGF